MVRQTSCPRNAAVRRTTAHLCGVLVRNVQPDSNEVTI